MLRGDTAPAFFCRSEVFSINTDIDTQAKERGVWARGATTGRGQHLGPAGAGVERASALVWCGCELGSYELNR